MFPVVWVVVVAAAPPLSATDLAETYKQADKLYAADRFGAAEPLFQAVLKTDDPFLKRQAFNRLLQLYIRSGRPDKAIGLSSTFRAWLQQVGDPDIAALELLVGRCRLELGYAELADQHLRTALQARPPLSPENRLEALRLRAEVASLQKDDKAEQARWQELERAAQEIARDATNAQNTPLRLQACRYYAEALLRRGDIDTALQTLAEFPAWHRQVQDSLGLRDTQRQRAKLYAAQGNYAQAAALYQQALELHREVKPHQRLIAGDILAEWSSAAVAAKKLSEAAKLRNEAAAEYRAVLEAPAEDPDTGGPLAAFNRLQTLTRSARQFQQALEVTLVAGERWSRDALVEARLQSDRGGLELMTSAYPTARKLLTAALADLDAATPKNLRLLPQVLVNLATAELACETPEKADALLARCLALYEHHHLPTDAVRVECEYLLGVSQHRRGDYAKAIVHLRNGLRLAEAVGPTADPVRFHLWLNIALIYKEQGHTTGALDALHNAATILTTFAEPDDLSSALIHAVRAELLLTPRARSSVDIRRQIAQAMELVPRIEAACEKHRIRSGYLWATAQHVRAIDLLSRKETRAAEQIWLALAAIQKKEGHILYARTLNWLGTCAELTGRDSEARQRFEEARAFQTNHPRCPPVTWAITLWRLAILTDKAGQSDEAKKLLEEVFTIADRARLNTFGEASQRAEFFSQFAPAFELLANWYARDHNGDGLLRVIVRSRSRTLLDQMLAAGVDPRAKLTGPERDELLARERAARQRVSQLRLQAMLIPADGTNDPVAQKLLADLEKAQRDFTDVWRRIADADPLTQILTDSTFTEKSLTQVRQAAHQAGGVLLTYMIGREASYAVLSTDPAGPLQVFPLTLPAAIANDLGELPEGPTVAAGGLRGLVYKPASSQPERPTTTTRGEMVPLTDIVTTRLTAHYLRQIADPSFQPTRGLVFVSQNPQQKTVSLPEVLGDAILPPALREKLRNPRIQRVVIIPDGALHKLPFECLLLSASPAPRYALDELPPLCYAPSIPALAVVLNRPRKRDGEATLLTVSDPEYPHGAGSMRTSLPRLPYTAQESQKVRQFFAPDRVTALAGAEATEAHVVASLPGQRFVHLAAHGFADEAFGNAFAAIALAPPRGNLEPSNDGFLTLHEISRLQLTGCELTVLSACVTNVGPQRPLEAGVTLAGAFLGAGARGVLASCWAVDDAATAELMGAFFSAIRPAQGPALTYADALKQARLAIRKKPGWEAPFFWAPFVYLGPPD
ncbi:MAG: CHAT domain-containing tetratricopeptide repeat protein [Gemmataceae bacterium]|nr:CHAT domain-containing protein [Gemmata sp.]MDW8197876.1 CHAT domain-containing tetratricopeptide repeat protein [Gemmataceae bacterium]